ncbi:MAG: phosphoribosyltransferase family protein [Candidatus Paceibacterota bacterium]
MEKTLKKLLCSLLDFILPKKEQIKYLELLTQDEFYEKTAKADRLGLGRQTFPIFDYRDSLVKNAIWEIKYRKNEKIIKLIGKILSDELTAILGDLSLFSNFNYPILIPIPLSKNRERQRGFNQCELIAKVICKNSVGIFFEKDILIKIKDTKPQTSFSDRKSRLENLKDCFEIIDVQKIKNQNIILLDDVTTTGATLNEAKKCLLNSGAKKVIAITIAH